MIGVGVAKGVLVADLCKMIVARVGVAALAIVKLVADRVVVVALDADDVAVAQEFEAAIRTGAKAAKIAKAVNGVDAPLPSVVERGREGEVVAIDAAEAGDALRCGHASIVWETVEVCWLSSSHFRTRLFYLHHSE